MDDRLPELGLGIGWRPELALSIERRADLGFVELLAEDFFGGPIPRAVESLRERGLAIVPHGVSLSLGGAERPNPDRLARLARLAESVNAPVVSEHLAFVEAGELTSGHLLPLPRTSEMLDIVVENVVEAQRALPVPLALENISTLFEWPNPEMSEAEFLSRVLERTGAMLLLDIENLYANSLNLGTDATAYLDSIPLDRIVYVHIAGGQTRDDGLYHDSHVSPVPEGVLDLLGELRSRTTPPGVMLERDGNFPPEAVLNDELDAIAEAMASRSASEDVHHVSG